MALNDPVTNRPPDGRCSITRLYHEGEEIKGFWGRAGLVLDALGMVSTNPALYNAPVPQGYNPDAMVLLSIERLTLRILT